LKAHCDAPPPSSQPQKHVGTTALRPVGASKQQPAPHPLLI